MKVQLDRIKDSPRPIRTSWDEDALNELARSIAEQGVIVPIKVRPANDAARGLCEMQAMRPLTREALALAPEAHDAQERAEYEIVYGHRRVEAARRANLTEIEAIVEGVDDTNALIQAGIENIQREDMAPLDKARWLQTVIDETGWSQGEIGRRGLMHQTRASQLLALLEMPRDVQAMIVNAQGSEVPDGKVTEGQVRAARRALDSQDTVFTAVVQKTAQEGLTAAQTRAVAETVAKTADPARRKALLETPYNPFIHNPEYAEANERADRIMAPAPGEDFARLPEIAVAIEQMKKLREAMRLTAEAIEIGKASPEAKRFIGRRMIDLGKELIKRGEALTS